MGERGVGIMEELVRLRAGGVEPETEGRRVKLPLPPPAMGNRGSRLCLIRLSDENCWRWSSAPDSLAVVFASSAESYANEYRLEEFTGPSAYWSAASVSGCCSSEAADEEGLEYNGCCGGLEGLKNEEDGWIPPACVELVCCGGEYTEVGNEVVVGDADKLVLFLPVLDTVSPPVGRLDIEAFNVGGNGSCDDDDCDSLLGFGEGNEWPDVAIEFENEWSQLLMGSPQKMWRNEEKYITRYHKAYKFCRRRRRLTFELDVFNVLEQQTT